jgi:hypothetical protein
MDIYEELMKNAGSLKDAEEETSGIDAFLSGGENRVVASSIDDFFNFHRVGTDTLIHKAEKDLWKVSEANGEVIIERLFDPDTKQPLRI